MNTQHKAVLFHKQKTSARTLFLKFASGSICNAGPFPEPAEMLEEPEADSLVPHPAVLLKSVAEQLSLQPEDLEYEAEFQAQVAYGKETAPVYLLRMTAEDPPRDHMSEQGGRFIAITEARQLPVVELQLLRRAYEVVLG
ncbi:MAG: hypothetical protein ACPG4N_10490 [Gammaproteobacteria bacterium]